MSVQVHHWDSRRDGALSEVAMREKLSSMGYSVSRYIYSPGTFFPDHTHQVDKIDAVLSGRFRLCIQGQTVILETGDYIEVPHGFVHSAEVVGDEAVISLDAIKHLS